jgi:hypothetical protein
MRFLRISWLLRGLVVGGRFVGREFRGLVVGWFGQRWGFAAGAVQRIVFDHASIDREPGRPGDGYGGLELYGFGRNDVAASSGIRGEQSSS